MGVKRKGELVKELDVLNKKLKDADKSTTQEKLYIQRNVTQD